MRNKKCSKKLIALATVFMFSGLVSSSTNVARAEISNTANVATEGKWMSGEYHAHTNQSNDTTVSSSKFENILDVAFREKNYLNIPGAANIVNDPAFDYFFLADHFRKSIADADGNSYSSSAYTPRYVAIEQQMNKFNQLQTQGKYKNKIFYTGVEWDMPGLDHAAVGIVNNDNTTVPVEAYHEFEWLYADQNNDPDSLYADNGKAELDKYGARKATSVGGRSDVNVTYQGVQWLKENYPDSYILPNHPSRHNGGSGVVTVENLRKMNDIAPNIVFGFEGMPGNQLSPDCTRCELNDIYGGADVMLAQVGGMWDSMLGEGRHFYTFTNSDFHFKTDKTYSSGYYPSEYSRNYTFVEPGEDKVFDFKDVVDGLRSGNSFAVYGDLINALDFSATNGKSTAVQGSDLNATSGEKVNLTIRFKVPAVNNYAKITEHDTTVSNKVSVDHVDLICGEITGKLNTSDYNSESNKTTSVIKTFYKKDWGKADAQGYYTVQYKVAADTNKYYRLRGTNLAKGTLGFTDNDGNPLKDAAYNSDKVTDFNTRVNALNDRNYAGLWFYSNPIFVYANASDDATVSNVVISTGKLTDAVKAVVKENNITATVANKVSSITVNITVNDKATWNLYSDKACTKVIANHELKLKTGKNNAYIKVKAEDRTVKVYNLTVIRNKAKK